MKIGIAGATGFIGQYLMDKILRESSHEIIAMARSIVTTREARITVRQVDLFSLKDAERGLANCDVALYLVHTISSSSRLSQGSFFDMDYILADNFAKAARDQGVKHIFCVSGLIPQHGTGSKHLESRLEVERALAGYGTPLTVFRCGVILGPGGFCFEMMTKLIRRLPVIILPKWAETECHPLYIDDLLTLIMNAINAGPDYAGVYDVGRPETYSYRRLILELAKVMGKRRAVILVPLMSARLSKYWLQLVSATPESLVGPLVDRLVFPPALSPDRLPPAALLPDWRNIEQALEMSVHAPLDQEYLIRATGIPTLALSEVRSVQRLPLPQGRDAVWAAREYMEFLPKLFSFLIKVRRRGDTFYFHFAGSDRPLLIMEYSQKRSSADRPLFYVKGGMLAKPSGRGRFEFRASQDGRFLIAAIHEYRPSLPWPIYRMSQALLHRWVMNRFGKYLARCEGLSLASSHENT